MPCAQRYKGEKSPGRIGSPNNVNWISNLCTLLVFNETQKKRKSTFAQKNGKKISAKETRGFSFKRIYSKVIRG